MAGRLPIYLIYVIVFLPIYLSTDPLIYRFVGLAIYRPIYVPLKAVQFLFARV